MNAQAQITSAVEKRIRMGGYNGFSFRDIARDTGLTNADVHHYLLTKSSIIARVADEYTVCICYKTL